MQTCTSGKDMTRMNAGARDNGNDGSTPGGGGEADRLGPGIWRITAVAVAGFFMPQLDKFQYNFPLRRLCFQALKCCRGLLQRKCLVDVDL
jgi:hypothetical protein